ncbi:MAG: response regulator [Desulfobacterales bacterium]
MNSASEPCNQDTPDNPARPSVATLNDEQPLYNSRITTVYIEYLEQHYPDIDIDALLAEAGMHRHQVEDPAHWFSQNQVDNFNRVLVNKTGDPHISRAVGRFVASSRRLGPLKKLTLGFVHPATIYMLCNRYSAMVSRGAVFVSRKTSANQVEVTARPRAGVKEQPYQCENRLGTLETLGKLISARYATVAHPQCIHRGDSLCRYEVTWDHSAAFWWKRAKHCVLLLSALLSAGLFMVTPLPDWLIANLILALLVMALGAYATFLENKELTRTITAQGDIAQEHLNEIQTRYNNNLLIQEIGKATATARSEKDLSRSVVCVMQSRLDFDRGLLLLADQEDQYLRYVAGYGFGDQKRDLLRFIQFRLGNPESKGVFVRSFHEQQPFIIDDIHGLKKQFSTKSQRLIESFGAHSLICVPIVFENRSLGIMAVDTITSRRVLLQSDLNLLMGIASHLAVSINNARAYQKLRRSEEKYRDIFENVSDFLYAHDLQGRLIEANIAFLKAGGIQDMDLTNLEIRNLLPAHLQPRFDEYLRDIQKNGQAEGITKLRRQDGSHLVVEYRNSLVYDDGQPVAVRGCGRDITERWQARHEKKRLEGMLERARKMEAIGTLAGGVAHDLNNILSGIVGFPELLLMDLPTDSPLRKPIKTIQESGQKAAAIVQDLLTMARRGVDIREVTKFNDIMSAYLDSPEHAKLIAHHPNVVVECKPAADLFNVLGSSVHLFKTLMNLVSNAAEAMPDGGMITITTANQYVDQPIKGYDVVAEGDYVVLTVQDNGLGISEKDQKRIFEPFYTKKVMGRSGTGLGMSVVWATVKDHLGYIDISSTIGGGTTVALYFPVTREQIQPEIRPRAIEDYRGNGESILVVDDIPEQREIATAMLRRLGYQVTTVASGEAAVDYLKTHRVNLLVLDMVMPPGMDGLETYRQIIDIHPAQKAVIASGFSESARVRQAQRLGAGAYIKKPYVMETIGLAVQAELNTAKKGPPPVVEIDRYSPSLTPETCDQNQP